MSAADARRGVTSLGAAYSKALHEAADVLDLAIQMMRKGENGDIDVDTIVDMCLRMNTAVTSLRDIAMAYQVGLSVVYELDR
jgi:hypothetical protein